MSEVRAVYRWPGNRPDKLLAFYKTWWKRTMADKHDL